MNFQGAIFDLDGTLLDSLDVWSGIDRDFLAKRGLPVPEDYAAAVAPMSFLGAAQYSVRRFGLPESPEELAAEWHRMAREAYAQRVELKPGALSYLLRLRELGVKLGVATGLTPELYRPALERTGALSLFGAFAGSGETGRGKDSPEVYLLAARRLGLPLPECLVFEDLSAGAGAARRAGALVCGVLDPLSPEEWPGLRRASHVLLSRYPGPFPGE